MNNSVLDIIVNLLGLSLLLWFLANALMDLIRGNKQKTVIHNLLIVGICLIYSVKILLKDLFGVI